MTARREIEQMKARGAGRPAPDVVDALYREAFERFGVGPPWSRKPGAKPTITQALVVARGLRTRGEMHARAFAARIEAGCRATL